MKKTFIALSIILCVFINGVSADTVKLKNGRSIGGELKEINEKDVILNIKAGSSEGSAWFNREEVESINELSIEEAKARLSTQDVFMSGDKKEMILASAKEGFNFVANTRKLEFKATPEIAIISTEQIKANMRKNIEKNYSEEKLNIRAKLLAKFGLIPNEKIATYRKDVLDVVGEQVAGYYDPDEKKIYVSDTELGPILPGFPSITIMHEQVHALQDQHYDLNGMEKRVSADSNDDNSLAFKSVIEGEATVLMYDAFLRSMGATDKSKEAFNMRSFVIDSMLAMSKRVKTEDGKPAIFMEDLLFPYVWGGTFIQHLVNTKGWEAVDSIYKDMPVSTEQIMHPEKYYIVRDDPKKVALPELSGILGRSWEKLTQDIAGEFGFYLMSKVFVDDLSSKMMSEGWGGDYFEFFEDYYTKQRMLVSLSKWDTEKDAAEFFNIYKQVIEKKYKYKLSAKSEGNIFQCRTEDGNVYISQLKDAVVIIEGATDDILEGLIKALTISNAETNAPG